MAEARSRRQTPQDAGTVLMTVDAVGGVWRYAMILSDGLVRRGWRVVLAVMGPAPSPAQEAEAGAIGAILSWGDYVLEWMRPNDADLAASSEWLLALERDHRPSVIHLNGYAHAVLPWAAPALVVAHSCVASWWRNVHGAPLPQDWQDYGDRVAAALCGAWPVVSPTAAFAAELVAIYGAIPTLRVIPNGMSAFTGRSAAKVPVVVAIGRAWDEAKNLQVLDRAAAGLALPVLIAGERRGPDGQERRFDHARGLGFVVDIPSLLENAAIFASPALYEPFGLSVLEAANAGCALLLGDIPTLRELWEGAARFVDPRDEAAWATALQGLLADRKARQAMGRAARRRSAEYGADRMIDAYATLYGELAGRRAA